MSCADEGRLVVTGRAVGSAGFPHPVLTRNSPGQEAWKVEGRNRECALCKPRRRVGRGRDLGGWGGLGQAGLRGIDRYKASRTATQPIPSTAPVALGRLPTGEFSPGALGTSQGQPSSRWGSGHPLPSPAAGSRLGPSVALPGWRDSQEQQCYARQALG